MIASEHHKALIEDFNMVSLGCSMGFISSVVNYVKGCKQDQQLNLEEGEGHQEGRYSYKQDSSK